MIKQYFKHLVPFIKLCFPLAVILLPVGLVVSSFSEWEPGEKTLNQDGSKSLLITGSSGGIKSYKNGEWDLSDYYEVKQFVVFPDVFTKPSVFYVTQYPDGRITSEEHELEALWMIFVYIVFCLITYMLWIRPQKSYNNTLKKRREERAS
ncbi:MAG: hypothetical protein OEY96_12240 [Gammaproteobacteria bacterium]|nr:hypothetical protein [Gammaproteobacteria bacterium]